MGAADELIGRTGKQTLLRETNDRVLGLTEDRMVDVAEFLCECGERGCVTPIRVMLSDYAETRRDPTLLFVSPGHLDGPHEVAYARPGYAAVRPGGAPGPAREASPADGGDGVRSRLVAIRDVLEREGQALAHQHDGRLLDVLVEIEEVKLSIARALGEAAPDRSIGLDS